MRRYTKKAKISPPQGRCSQVPPAKPGDYQWIYFFEPQNVEQLQQLERNMNHEGAPRRTKEGKNGYEGQKLRAPLSAFVVKNLNRVLFCSKLKSKCSGPDHSLLPNHQFIFSCSTNDRALYVEGQCRYLGDKSWHNQQPRSALNLTHNLRQPLAVGKYGIQSTMPSPNRFTSGGPSMRARFGPPNCPK